jgi:hypothetical protein
MDNYSKNMEQSTYPEISCIEPGTKKEQLFFAISTLNTIFSNLESNIDNIIVELEKKEF